MSTHRAGSKCSISSHTICQTISFIYWTKVSVPSSSFLWNLVSRISVFRACHVQKDEAVSLSPTALLKKCPGLPKWLFFTHLSKDWLVRKNIGSFLHNDSYTLQIEHNHHSFPASKSKHDQKIVWQVQTK